MRHARCPHSPTAEGALDALKLDDVAIERNAPGSKCKRADKSSAIKVGA